MIITATLGALFALVVEERRLAAGAGVGAGLLVLPAPVVIAAAAAAGVFLGLKRFGGRGGREGDSAVVLLADLVVLGLRAGLTLETALRDAAADLPPRLAAEVGAVLRAARRSGLAMALREAEGQAERLFRTAAHAVQTGAPLTRAVEALAAEMRRAEHARRSAAARRLPVRLLLPLALLILPGFVLLVVGPALLGSLARLEIGW